MKRISAIPGKRSAAAIFGFFGFFVFSALHAQDEAEIAKQLANPISSLISVSFQGNYDENFGPNDQGSILRINVQPVIPFSLNDDWNLISRTILPIIDQKDVPTPGVSEFGLGDTVQSLFFSPTAPTSGGWIWGAGPVFLLPTATDDVLGSEKWGIGPTGVVLKQSGPWSYGALANHIESVGGDSARADISATLLQPFLSYVTASHTTYTLSTESTYDWESKEWSVPVNFKVAQILRVGNQLIQVVADPGPMGRLLTTSSRSGGTLPERI